MIAIRNSKLYILIALLLSIATLGYSVAWYVVVGAVAAIAGLIMFIDWLLNGKIQELIKDLYTIEDDLGTSQMKRIVNVEKLAEFDRLIEEEEAAAQQAQSKLYTAKLEYDAAETAYEAAKKDVKEKSEASRKAKLLMMIIYMTATIVRVCALSYRHTTFQPNVQSSDCIAAGKGRANFCQEHIQKCGEGQRQMAK